MKPKTKILDRIIIMIFSIFALLAISQCDLKDHSMQYDLKLRQYHKAFITEDVSASDYCANSPECYVTDENGEMLTFNLTPPENVRKWQIKRVELVGNYNDYQRHWMNVAYKISNYDKEFMYMLKGENGLFNHDRQSLVYEKWYVYKNIETNEEVHVRNERSYPWELVRTYKVREPSYGFCQIHKGFHPQIVNDPRFFSDPKWQLEQCYRLWKSGTAFYGYRHREKAVKHFKFY